jgi:hypothetical protein
VGQGNSCMSVCIRRVSQCEACGETDDSQDPVDKLLLLVCALTGLVPIRLWAYKPFPDGKTHGTFCGYCFKAWDRVRLPPHHGPPIAFMLNHYGYSLFEVWSLVWITLQFHCEVYSGRYATRKQGALDQKPGSCHTLSSVVALIGRDQDLGLCKRGL